MNCKIKDEKVWLSVKSKMRKATFFLIKKVALVCFLAFIYEPNMQGKFQLKQEQKEQHNLAKTPFDLILASRLKTQISK